MKRRQLLAGAGGLPLAARALPDLPVIAADTAPFAHRDYRGELRGAALDAMHLAALRLGLRWAPELVPPARAMLRALDARPQLIVAPPRVPQHEARMRWVHPLIDIELFLWARRDEQFRAQERGSGELDAGVMRGTALYDLSLGLGLRRLQTFSTQDVGVRMLLAGRFDVLIASEPMVHAALRQLGLPLDVVRPGRSLGVMSLYLAATLATPAEAVQAWRGTLAALLEEGDLARSHARYGLKAPAPLPA